MRYPQTTLVAAPSPPCRMIGMLCHGRLNELGYRYKLRPFWAAHVVSVAVWQNDHISGTGPVTFALQCLNPCMAAGDYVEEDHSLGFGRQNGERVPVASESSAHASEYSPRNRAAA